VVWEEPTENFWKDGINGRNQYLQTNHHVVLSNCGCVINICTDIFANMTKWKQRRIFFLNDESDGMEVVGTISSTSLWAFGGAEPVSQ
jgi:hypothetical protein